MLGLLFSLLILGIAAGFLARLLVPGPDPMGFWATALLGVGGSFAGGLLATLLFEGRLVLRGSGLLGSVVGAVIILLIVRYFSARNRVI